MVRLDGEEIPAAEIAAEMPHHPAASGAAAWQQAAEAVVLRRLLLREAATHDLVPAPGDDETPEDALLRALLESELTLPEADDATCRRWYEANRGRFRTPPAWQAEHLLIAADPADATARAAARDRAEALLAELRVDPDRLAELARGFSACPSRARGGDLGLVTRGSTVPEFEAALAATPPGALCERVVETRYGFHLLRVRQRAEPREIPYEMVRADIADWLEEAAWRRAAHQYLALLAGRATIEGLRLAAGADGPLVQ